MIKTITQYILPIFVMVPLFLVLSLLYSIILMLVWDISMPYLFGLSKITWLQSWCLIVISNILFKASNVKK